MSFKTIYLGRKVDHETTTLRFNGLLVRQLDLLQPQNFKLLGVAGPSPPLLQRKSSGSGGLAHGLHSPWLAVHGGVTVALDGLEPDFLWLKIQ